MSKIVVQMGHVPRTSGATGTHREQEFNKLVGPKLAHALNALGHSVFLIGADDLVPSADIFVALHCDGNTNTAKRGGSVGYPSDDPNSPSGRLAAAWKRHHQQNGYSGGFNPDNYTKGLRYYYGFRKSNAKLEFLAEHGTTTNPDDETWLFANIDACVQAHVDAIGEVVGHPSSPGPSLPNVQIPTTGDDEMKPRLVRGPQGDVYVFDGAVLRPANNQTYQDLVRFYAGQKETWDQWSQEQIDAVPKEKGVE